jgi:hypothetical protein
MRRNYFGNNLTFREFFSYPIWGRESTTIERARTTLAITGAPFTFLPRAVNERGSLPTTVARLRGVGYDCIRGGRELGRLEFRAEFFNVFNVATFGLLASAVRASRAS